MAMAENGCANYRRVCRVDYFLPA
jgi:hypothetical protein